MSGRGMVARERERERIRERYTSLSLPYFVLVSQTDMTNKHDHGLSPSLPPSLPPHLSPCVLREDGV